MSRTTVALVDELAANAWPAAVNQMLDGWQLRWNWGVTRRANSVLPGRDGGRYVLDDKLALIEEFYRRRNTPPRFHICPAAEPSGLDRALEARGYFIDCITQVQIAALPDVLQRAHAAPEHTVTISEAYDADWFATYCLGEGVAPEYAQRRSDILQRIGPRTGYARLDIEGVPAAVAFGVLERGWVGIFNVVTRPEYRRRGAATALLHALAAWGEAQGATHMYLQVMEQNTTARSLYASCGFSMLYTYHYREGQL